MYLRIESDLIMLADDCEIAADNERVWARGSDDPEEAQMHVDNAEELAEVAKVYRRMAKDARELYETYGG